MRCEDRATTEIQAAQSLTELKPSTGNDRVHLDPLLVSVHHEQLMCKLQTFIHNIVPGGVSDVALRSLFSVAASIADSPYVTESSSFTRRNHPSA